MVCHTVGAAWCAVVVAALPAWCVLLSGGVESENERERERGTLVRDEQRYTKCRGMRKTRERERESRKGDTNRGEGGRRWKGGEQEIWNKIIKSHESRKKPVRAVSREIARGY